MAIVVNCNSGKTNNRKQNERNSTAPRAVRFDGFANQRNSENYNGLANPISREFAINHESRYM